MQKAIGFLVIRKPGFKWLLMLTRKGYRRIRNVKALRKVQGTIEAVCYHKGKDPAISVV